MTVENLLFFAKQHIHSDHAKILLAELLNKNPLELLNYLNLEVDDKTVETYKAYVKALEEGKPLQYVMGYVNFYGNTFEINENVLIPRYETEELVEKTIEFAKKFFTTPVDIIDLGTGSGVIGLTLEKKLSTNSVDLVDISKKALEVTHQNCVKLNSKANLIESDMFKNVEKKYDIIISNPPYIKTGEEIEEIVKNNEPSLALYAGKDGLDCYKKILQDILPHTKERCLIAFEIGMTQGDTIKDLVKEYLPNTKVEVYKDLSERDRMLFIFKNLE